ncbi:phage terminase small subunit [Novispirillum itersonii]|uniref:phage terminase small subunit n=1 Tax=Novispirillum itersonii TaxID=189 RepID=UPI000362A604|nr:phage terminase small subunit [Novispirillum itersonii]
MSHAIRRHYEETSARLQAEAAGSGGVPPARPVAGDNRTPVAALLASHQFELKQTKSLQRKLAYKGKVLPEYAAYVSGVLAANQPVPDPVVLQIFIWRIDTGDFAGALEIARWAMAHGIALPDGIGFKRTLPEVLIEEMAEIALGGITAGAADPDLIAPLEEALALVADVDMADEIRAKAHKAAGRLRADTDPARALAHLEQANTLNPSCGVKGDIKALQKALATPPPDNPEPETGEDPPADPGA